MSSKLSKFAKGESGYALLFVDCLTHSLVIRNSLAGNLLWMLFELWPLVAWPSSLGSGVEEPLGFSLHIYSPGPFVLI